MKPLINSTTTVAETPDQLKRIRAKVAGLHVISPNKRYQGSQSRNLPIVQGTPQNLKFSVPQPLSPILPKGQSSCQQSVSNILASKTTILPEEHIARNFLLS
jgi:hypothetical protein